MTKDEAIKKLDRVGKWINKFPVPTEGATAMMGHIRDVGGMLADMILLEAPTSEAVAALQKLENPYNPKDHGSGWYAASHAWDECMVTAIRALRRAAQPAADPAPVPAQTGIDHAKRVEGEAEVLRDLHAAAMREPVGETFGAIMAAIQHLEWLDQQAGVPDGWREFIEAIAAYEPAGDWVDTLRGFKPRAQALLAAAPGEAG